MFSRTPLIGDKRTDNGKPIENRAAVRTFLERGGGVCSGVKDAVMTAVGPTARVRDIVDDAIDGDVGIGAVLTVERRQLGERETG
jgi:hypothetical protein